MITAITLCALSILSQVPDQLERPTIENAITAMFVKYANAKSVVADIKFTQTAQGKSIQILSYLQYERDDKFYLSQTADQKVATVIADGKYISYPVPMDFSGRKGEVIVELQEKQGIVDVLTASSRSLFDNCPMIDVIVSRPKYLKALTQQWQTLKWEQKESQDRVAVGDWRSTEVVGPTGRFRLEMTSQGDPVRYTITERIIIPKQNLDIEVVSDWQIKVKFDAQGDKTLYKATGN